MPLMFKYLYRCAQFPFPETVHNCQEKGASGPLFPPLFLFHGLPAAPDIPLIRLVQHLLDPQVGLQLLLGKALQQP